jgi:hypothetical protein
MESSSDIIINSMAHDMDKMRAIIYTQQGLIKSQQDDIEFYKILISHSDIPP